MKYIAKIILGATVMSLVMAKSITFNIVSVGCELDQVPGSSHSEGVKYSPVAPMHISANESVSFKVDIVPSAIPYNTNNELLSSFGLYYKVNCPKEKKAGHLKISGKYNNWDYFGYLGEGNHVTHMFMGSGAYNSRTARIIVKP